MLLLAVCIHGDGVELAGSSEVVVGVGLAFGHGGEFLHHDLFNTVRKLGKAACNGLVIGDHQLVEGLLIDIHVKVILNSDVFHMDLLFISQIWICFSLL